MMTIITITINAAPVTVPPSLFNSLSRHVISEDTCALFVLHTCLHTHAALTARTDSGSHKLPQIVAEHRIDKCVYLTLPLGRKQQRVCERRIVTCRFDV
jgi:hypothetical protein